MNKELQKGTGISVYKLGNRTIFDMRGAMNGLYEDKNLKTGDCVIWSDRKIYRVVKNHTTFGATYLKMTKNEINDLKKEIDKAISEKQQTII